MSLQDCYDDEQGVPARRDSQPGEDQLHAHKGPLPHIWLVLGLGVVSRWRRPCESRSRLDVACIGLRGR